MTAQSSRLVGPNAAVRKYDVLTAISIASLRDGPLTPTQGLRLVALITAHYDWTRDEVAIGQDALMRLWGVSKRTVIRDLAVFRSLGLLQLIAAGRRGRVAVHRLGHLAINALNTENWVHAGAAFAQRMEPYGADSAEPDGATEGGRPTRPSDHATPPLDPPLWSATKARLADTLSPAAIARWIDPLRVDADGGAVLRLVAPTRFHAAYVEREHGDRIAVAASQARGRAVRLTFVEQHARRAGAVLATMHGMSGSS